MGKSQWRSKNLSVAFYGIFASFLLVAFQNCSNTTFTSTEQPQTNRSNEGGTGIDGKAYLSFGECPLGDVALKDKIVIAKDSKAYLVRENCADLAKPRLIEASQLQFATGNSAVFKFGQKVFDLQAPQASQNVTLSFCHYSGPSLSLQTLVWQNANTPLSLLGSLLENQNISSGVLNVESPSPSRYSTIAGQSSEFQLDLTGNSTAAITYSIGGRPQNSLSLVDCATQSPKPIDDGSADAALNAPQKASLLAGYMTRPSWNVAGVDYAVGPKAIPSIRPSTLARAGVTVNTSTRVVTVSGNGISLDGVDFSLEGGYDLVVTGQNVTISNSVFIQGANSGLYAIDARGGGLTISHCILDGGTADNVALIGFSGRGINLLYNWFKNSDRMIQMRQANTVTSSFVVKYNLFESANKNGFNYIEMGVSNFENVQIEFNTSVETAQATRAHGFDFGRFAGGTTNGILFANNTLLSLGAASMDYPINGGGNSTSNGVARDNYFDLTGALGAYYPSSMSGWSTVSGVNLTTGNSF